MLKKCCWLAKEHKKGWRLAFCKGNDKPKYLDFWFEEKKDIDSALKRNVVFVFMDTEGE
jgi:hypothetical protein